MPSSTNRVPKLLVPLAVAALSAALLVMPAAAEMDFGMEKFKAGDSAPDFTTTDIDGNKIVFSSFQGSKVVLLNFWGLRCGACIEEIPYLNKMAETYIDKGLVILGVDTDGVDADTVRSTMKDVGIVTKYPVLLDTDFSITDVYTNFMVPLTLVIDKGGTIQFIHTGYEEGDEEDYEKAVRKALGL